LRAIADMLPERACNPFGIICGTSAGSVNAASLASDADRFDRRGFACAPWRARYAWV
jgi:predicted acylesterase/phospholipase RssA